MGSSGRRIGAAIASLLVSACGTIASNKEEVGFWMSGPVFDVKGIGVISSDVVDGRVDGQRCCLGPVLVFVYFVDIPISFVADSIWWGIVDPLSRLGGGEESPAPKARQDSDDTAEPTYPISGGCGDLLAYAATANRLEYVVVQLDRAKFDLTDDRAVHDLSAADPSIEVSIDRYSVAPKEPYCTDLEPPPGSEHRVMHWKATRGRLKIVALDPLPELHSGKTYRVRVRLEDVEFKDVNGAVMSRGAIEFEAKVGWMSG
jgi:hypothetical protein